MTHTIPPDDTQNALIAAHARLAALQIREAREHAMRSFGQFTRHVAVGFMAEMQGNRAVFADNYYL
jgi:hypothetical protein